MKIKKYKSLYNKYLELIFEKYFNKCKLNELINIYEKCKIKIKD